MAVALAERPVFSQGDTDVVSIDYTEYLDAGELLTGTPTVSEVTTSDLTLANKAVSTSTTTVLGIGVAVGAAVQFSITGQQAGTTYRVRVTTSTDATITRTKVVDVLLECAAAADT